MMMNNEEENLTYDFLLQPRFNSAYPECCRNCPNNPNNGGSGICNCALPYMTSTGDYPSWK